MKSMPILNQKGFAHFLLLFAAVGLIGFIAISSSAEFKNKLFSSLFPKPSSHASENSGIEFVDDSGQVITSTASANVKVKLTYVPPVPTPTPTAAPKEIKMMLIQYVPPGGVQTIYPQGIADTTGFIKNNFITGMNDGTKFHGYSDPSAQGMINFTLAPEDIHTFSNPPPTRPDNYLGAPPKADNQPGYLDVAAIFRQNDICNVAKQKDIKAVIFFMADYGEYGPKGFEDYITGSKGIPTNGPILRGADYCDDKTIYIVNPVYTRGLAEALESYGHHLEGVVRHFKPSDYSSWSDEANNPMFVGPYFPAYRGDSCGIDHNPPNARNEYDRSNTADFQSDCRNWKADGTGVKEALNCNAWGCTGDGWLVWWMQNMPSEWWSYVSDPDNSVVSAPTSPVKGDFSNLSATLCNDKATFNFNYSGSSPSFNIDMGADPDSFTSGYGIYFNFTTGTNSPIVEINIAKMGQYTAGKNMSWRIKNSNDTTISPVQLATVNCTPSAPIQTPTPAPVPTPIATPVPVYPSDFKIANSQTELSTATEQLFDSNPKTFDWTLSGDAGPKTVYVQFKVNGVWEDSLTATIDYNPPIPTPSPTPTVDKIPPSVSITNPTNGSIVKTNSKVNITAIASDNIKISKVEFYVGKDLKCTSAKSTGPYTCKWSVPGKKGTNYNISVKAYDSSENTNSATISVKTQ